MNKIIYCLLTALTIVGCTVPKEAFFVPRLSTTIIRDIANPIAFNGGNLKDYDVSISNGTIITVEEKQLTVLVDSLSRTTITLKKGSSLKKFDFRVIAFPKPKLWIVTDGDGNANNMTAKEFRTFHNVLARLNDFTIDCVLIVESMEILRIKPDGTQTAIVSKAPKEDWSRLARASDAGDTYIFSNIKIRIKENGRIVAGQEFTMHLK